MKDLVTSAIAFVVLAGVNLLAGILVARVLGPAGRGELAAVLLWPQIAAMIGGALVVDAVVHAAANRPQDRARTAASGAALGLLLSLPLAAVAAIAAIATLGHFRAEVRAAALLYAAFIPLSLAATALMGVFQGAGRFATWSGLRILVTAAYAGFVLAFLWLDRISVGTVALASLLGNALTLAAAILLLRRAGWLSFGARIREMRRFLAYCLPIGGGSALMLLGERLDQILISQWESAAAFGLYVVAAGLAAAANGFASILGAVALPKIAARTDAADRASMLGLFIRVTIVAIVPMAAALAILADWVVTFLYGAAFAPAAGVLRVLCIGFLPYAVKYVLLQGFKAHGRTKPIAAVEAVTVATGALSLVLFVPSLGIVGAALSFALAQAAGMVHAVIRARRDLRMGPAALFAPGAADIARLRALVAGLRP